MCMWPQRWTIAPFLYNFLWQFCWNVISIFLQLIYIPANTVTCWHTFSTHQQLNQHTHLHCRSSGKPFLAISSLSFHSAFNSALVILFRIFLAVVVQWVNHPGVFVSATSRFIIVATSCMTSFCQDHQRTSVSRYCLSLIKGAFLSACQVFWSHWRRS